MVAVVAAVVLVHDVWGVEVAAVICGLDRRQIEEMSESQGQVMLNSSSDAGKDAPARWM